MSVATKRKDNDLLKKIRAAVAICDTAHVEFVSRSKTVGLLLLEAKKLHPKVGDFETFLKRVHGLHRSRAYELLRLAGGRATDAEIRADTAARVKKHRDKKKRLSVTDDHVTETAEPDTHAAPLTAEPHARRAPITPAAGSDSASREALAELKFACRTYLPRMSSADLAEAFAYASDNEWAKR